MNSTAILPSGGQNRQAKKPEDETEINEIAAAPLSKEFKKRWSYFIRKVYKTDPLACPKCQGEMRIISFINWWGQMSSPVCKPRPS